MANPFVEPTITGYNASPPPDDGSNTSQNEITWAGIKGKVGDPLRTYADVINANTLAAFAKMFGSDISAISTDYTVVSDDQGKMLACSGTHTISLPAAGTIAKPFCIVIRNIGTGTITIDPNGSETIDGLTTIALGVGEWATLVTDGAAWRTINNIMAKSLGTNGYVILPSGLTINWGQLSFSSEASKNATFSSAYASAFYVGVAIPNNASGNCWISATNTTAMTITFAGAVTAAVFWISIGL